MKQWDARLFAICCNNSGCCDAISNCSFQGRDVCFPEGGATECGAHQQIRCVRSFNENDALYIYICTFIYLSCFSQFLGFRPSSFQRRKLFGTEIMMIKQRNKVFWTTRVGRRYSETRMVGNCKGMLIKCTFNFVSLFAKQDGISCR